MIKMKVYHLFDSLADFFAPLLLIFGLAKVTWGHFMPSITKWYSKIKATN